MDLEKAVLEIHTKIHEVDARTQVIESSLNYIQDAQTENKGNISSAKKDIDKLQAHVDNTRGAVKILALVALLLGIAVSLTRLI